jgi:hypothetical protein
MATVKRRLDRINISLSPRRAVLAWMAEAPSSGFSEEYVPWFQKQYKAGNPLLRLLDQVTAATLAREKGAPKTKQQKQVHAAVGEAAFLYLLQHKVNFDFVRRRPSMALEVASLLKSDLAAFQQVRVRGDTLGVLRYLVEEPYPLDAEDASSVLAAARNCVVTFARLKSITTWPFYLQDNPVVSSVRAHFARRGKTVIPPKSYFARDCCEYAKERAQQRAVHASDPEQIRKLFVDRRAYSDFVSSRDFSFGLADVRDEEFNRVVMSVIEGLRRLTEAGEIRAARQVSLISVPVPFLQTVPVVENEWIDRHVVELAELGCRLLEEGYVIQQRRDIHVLAWPVISGPNLTEANLKAIKAKAAASLSEFPGRVTSVEGRPFLNLADYAAWPHRKLRGELKVQEGFFLASFNAWAEKSKLTRRAELNGISVEPIRCPVTASSLLVSADASLKQSDRAKAVDTLLASTANRMRLDDPAERFDTFALDILTFKAAVEYIETKFFEGHRVLWKPFDDELKRYVKILSGLASVHADWDSRIWLLDAMEECFQPAEPSDRRRSSKLDLDRLERSIDQSKCAESLITEAKASALSAMGNGQAAWELLSSTMLRRIEVSDAKRLNGLGNDNRGSLKRLAKALGIGRTRA